TTVRSWGRSPGAGDRPLAGNGPVEPFAGREERTIGGRGWRYERLILTGEFLLLNSLSSVALSASARIFPTLPIQDRRMAAAIETTPAAAGGDYKSRPGALVWFFKKSRNNWKEKYRALKASVKGLKNQLAAVTRSRAEWRAEAEAAGRRAA